MRLKLIFLSWIAVWLLAACETSSTPTATPPAASPASQNPSTGSTPAAPPTQGPPVRLTIAAGAASSPAYLPLDVAQAQKYFEAEGLSVDVHHLADGTQAAEAMLSGAALFAGGTLETAVKAQPQGKLLKLVVSFARLPGVVVLVRADLKDAVKSPADFKGRKIGVGAIGSDTHALAVALAARAGLTPDDYKIVPVGAGSLAVAFEQKEIDVGLGADPFATALLKQGAAGALADLRTQAGTDKYLGGEFQSAGLLVDAATIRSRPDLVQKVVNAVVKAMAFMQAHSARELSDLLPDALTGQDKQAWIDMYSASQNIYSRDSQTGQGAVENAVAAYRLLGLIRPDLKIDSALLFDNTFVEQAK